MTVKIEPIEGPHRIDVKRLALPFTISTTCPNCKIPIIRKLNDGFNYLTNPPANVPFAYDFYCGEGCDHEWWVEVQLGFTLKVVTDEA